MTSVLVLTTINAKFVELGRTDCKGQIHFLPDTPFATVLDLGTFKGVLETFNDRITARALERCPSITTYEIKRRLYQVWTCF